MSCTSCPLADQFSFEGRVVHISNDGVVHLGNILCISRTRKKTFVGQTFRDRQVRQQPEVMNLRDVLIFYKADFSVLPLLTNSLLKVNLRRIKIGFVVIKEKRVFS